MKRVRPARSRASRADDAPLTAAELRTARPAREAIPHIVAAVARRGRPKGQSKTQVTLRLDNDVVAKLRAAGDGWQTRVNGLLRAAIGLRR
ncbi:MAG: BrnA antitoxin family protein [Reyranella sp.]|nr:BrnA antitoxin family protein [Reyranella sp.]